MNLAPFQPGVVASSLPPERLAGNPHLSEREKVAEASRQFEAILLRQILQHAQQTVIPSKYADTSTAASIYRDLATYQLADSISKSGALGLAKTFAQQLDRATDPASKAGSGSAPGASLASPPRAAARPEFPPAAGRAAALHSAIHPRRAAPPLLNVHE